MSGLSLSRLRFCMEPPFPLYLPSDSLSFSHFRLSSVLYNLSLCLWNRDSLLFLSLYLNNTKRRHDDSVSHLSQSLLWIPCSLPPSRSLFFFSLSINRSCYKTSNFFWLDYITSFLFSGDPPTPLVSFLSFSFRLFFYSVFD